MTKDQFNDKVKEFKSILLIENKKLKDINPDAEKFFENRINEIEDIVESASRMLAINKENIDYGSVLLTASRMHLREVQDYLETDDENTIAVAVDSLDHIFNFYFKILDFIMQDKSNYKKSMDDLNNISEQIFKSILGNVIMGSIRALKEKGGNSEVTAYMLNRFSEIGSYIDDSINILGKIEDNIEYGSVLLVASKMQYLEMTKVIKESKLNPGELVKFILNYIGAIYFEVLFEIKKVKNKM
ncbi:hypothetical protein STIUS_v1c05620 [Spiroplasma sp. TIUS-1]|uniref:hypothetical protein n=1 Tax=Spiroplasma sp. TIUS-1 TaxID=216963 RepID=UPI001397C293|nr:hypothetical protein [Spiroplasma sp. TIUS-1]QHX36116.1 hypothetical protein STIUS_v1c05620 [Spiroplasma sp. TIUS-1]